MKLSLLPVLFLVATSCFASNECQSTFYAGKGIAQITFCVTENGNIAELQTNSGQRTLLNGAEGFAVCVPGASYYDLGIYGDSGNWQPSVITQPKGPNTFPLTITRSSTDLTPDGLPGVIVSQQFSFSNGGRSVRVTMVRWGSRIVSPIIRYADVQGSSEHAGNSAISPFIWNDGGAGLVASPTGNTLSPGILYGGISGLMAGSQVDPCNAVGPDTFPYQGDSAFSTKWFVTGAKGKANQATVDYIPVW